MVKLYNPPIPVRIDPPPIFRSLYLSTIRHSAGEPAEGQASLKQVTCPWQSVKVLAMRSWTVVSLSCISLLCVQQLQSSLALPSPQLPQLPAPRESPDGEEHLKELTTVKQPLLSTPTMDLMIHLRTLRRKRRRARRLHPPRLMRVGCSLGTCHVQNLNHRLWQLMGQMGKEDSPIQLSNPHSFG
ncbi:protein ADM2 [Bufo gargarizans]|uniref:protein ADM2 n=1 Tax=Bufo gargarizans TaxID=30331 RepID=UPI001CF2F2BE|nr:protein ADM2 [Bufo gargarizans]